MFANVLNSEEKEKFLELVYKVATVDGKYADEEQELVNSYKAELGLSMILDTDNVESLIGYFSLKPIEIQKIILFEMYGMIMADGKIKAEEEQILSTIYKKFNLDKEEIDAIVSVAKELQQVYDKVYDVLF